VLQIADRFYVLRGRPHPALHDGASNLQEGKAIMEADFGFGDDSRSRGREGGQWREGGQVIGFFDRI